MPHAERVVSVAFQMLGAVDDTTGWYIDVTITAARTQTNAKH